MDIEDIRVVRLRKLIADEFEDNQTLFATKLGFKQSHVNRWISPTAKDRRRITEDSARKIEKAAGKHKGWMDTMEERSPLVEKYMAVFETLDPEIQKNLISQAEFYKKLQKN